MSSGVDEKESEEEDQKSPVNKTKLKSLVPNKTKLLMKQRENLLEGPKKSTITKNLPIKPKSSILPSSSMATISKSLSLSESDDSDLEDQKDQKTPKMAKTSKTSKSSKNGRKSSKKNPEKSKMKSESESDFSGEEIDFSSQLECLAQSQAFQIDTKVEKSSPKKSPMKANSSLLKADASTSMNIASLLAQGEGVSLSDSEADSEAETEVKPEVKSEESEKPLESVTIEMPHEDAIRRRKKKGFDMEAWVRRELGRAQRELQMLKHQAHVACLLAHLRYLNSFAGKYILCSLYDVTFIF